MDRQKLNVGLPTGRTILTAHMFNLEPTQRLVCQLYGEEKEDIVPILCHWPIPACKIYRTLGRVFLKPKDLENMRVNGLKSLVAKTRVGKIS